MAADDDEPRIVVTVNGGSDAVEAAQLLSEALRRLVAKHGAEKGMAIAQASLTRLRGRAPH